MKAKLKIDPWDRLVEILPVLNQHEIERRCGFRKGRLYDCRAGRSTLSSAELETVRKHVASLLQ